MSQRVPFVIPAVLLWIVTVIGVSTAKVCSAGEAHASAAIPISITLDRPGYVTLVIEDASGNRVRNMLAETLLPGGASTIYWDGYNDGERNPGGALIRHRVAPGRYRLRGLTHSGIYMRYEMTVDNPGTPPWITRDGSGGWLADHSPPADILALPDGIQAPNGKGQVRFLVCSTSAEAGNEFVWLNAEGRKLYGTNDGFWGGTHLARDTGPHPAPYYDAYVFESGQRDSDNFNLEVRGFRAGSGALESVIKYPRPHSLRTFKGNEAYGSDGIAAYNGRLVMAITMLNRLVFVDLRQKRVLGEVTLLAPRSPAFDAQGRLYLLSGAQVKRYSVPRDRIALEDEKTLIPQGLEAPRRLRLDAQGRLLVSDWGKSHQVKIYDTQGRPLRTVGMPGGPQVGRYDERRMAYPCGATVDTQGQIWVAEGDLPKRISIWRPDGGFARAFYGPEKYGGGGALDPKDPTRFYYEEAGTGIEFALDRATGRSKVAGIYWSPNRMPAVEPMPGPAPERAYYVGGHQYMVNCFNGGLRFNTDRGVGIWRMDADHIAHPVAMIGNGADLVNHIWGWSMKHRDAIVRLWADQRPDNVLFVWCDKNGDGVAQPGEIQWIAEDHSAPGRDSVGGIGLEPWVHPDLSVTTAYGTVIPAPRFNANGVPIYDLAKHATFGDTGENRPPFIVGNLAITHRDSDGSWLGFDASNQKRWCYPATPEQEIGGPGAMVSPTRLLGPPVTPKEGQAGPLVAINGEMGAIFLLTMDGLFVQTLGGDARLFPPLAEMNPHRGWTIKDVSFQQEHFHPTITQEADGSISMVIGFQQGTIVNLEGWNTIQRREFGAVEVSTAQLAGIPEQSIQSSRREGRLSATVAVLAEGPKVDGGLTDWPAGATWMKIDERASAAVAVDSRYLYVAAHTGDPLALENAATDARYLFKGGGGLDLMLATGGQNPGEHRQPASGDIRVLVARSGGKPRVVLYRAVSAGSAPAAPVVYESPIGKVTFAEVREITEGSQVAQHEGDFEARIPLDALGWKPEAGHDVLADIGLLRGQEGRTMQRVYWSNKNTLLVSDLPTEARLEPAEWGVWKFSSENAGK